MAGGILGQIALPPPDPRQTSQDAYGNQRQLSYADMLNYMRTNPAIRPQYLAGIMEPYQASTPEADYRRLNSIVRESSAVADPFGFISAQRAMGSPLDPRIILNEDHGLANKQNDSQRYGNNYSFSTGPEPSVLDRIIQALTTKTTVR